jgi:hypothetical protein
MEQQYFFDMDYFYGYFQNMQWKCFLPDASFCEHCGTITQNNESKNFEQT